MKAIAKIVLEVIWKFIVSVLSEDEIKKILQDVVKEWCTKHLTAEEIKNEVSDFGKWLKEKVKNV